MSAPLQLAPRCPRAVLLLACIALAHLPAGAQPPAVAFQRPEGTLTVWLPADIRAGDVISGTVVAAPAGETAEERARNTDVLQGLVVAVGGEPVQPAGAPLDSAAAAPLRFVAAAGLARRFGGRISAAPASVELRTPAGEVLGRVALPQPTAQTPRADEFWLPALGQQGRPVEIAGPFDGDAANTVLRASLPAPGEGSLRPASRAGPVAELAPLAESPRGAVFESPRDAAGAMEIELREGPAQLRGAYRSVGVRLTAEKTSLMAGEQTMLVVEVEGLGGAAPTLFPVQLTLENLTPTVVGLEGGVVAVQDVQPAQVGADGRYTAQRVLTGQVPGTFSVRATVTGGQPAPPMLARPRLNPPQPWDSRAPDVEDAPVHITDDVTHAQLMAVSDRRLNLTRCDLIERRRWATTWKDQLWFDEKIAKVERVMRNQGWVPADCRTYK